MTQLLDFKFNPAAFEQDLNVWETIKTRYERQSGQPLPDGVLVATLPKKTTGALQQRLRLNARTLQTDAQVREVILEYHRSRLLMNPVIQTAANATFQGGAAAPMDIGALAAALTEHEAKVKHLLKYLAGTKHFSQKLQPTFTVPTTQSNRCQHLR